MVNVMQAKHKLLFQKSLIFICALFIVGFGVNLLAESKLGGDGITVLYMGMKASFGFQYGISSYIYNLTVITFAIFFARRYLGLGTFIYSFGIGFFVFIFENLIAHFQWYPTTLFAQYAFLILGQVLLALGMGIIISLRLGINALDCLVMQAVHRTKLSYRSLRISADASITALGFLMGGLVGIGTLLSVITLGILIQFFTGLADRFIVFKQS